MPFGPSAEGARARFGAIGATSTVGPVVVCSPTPAGLSDEKPRRIEGVGGKGRTRRRPLYSPQACEQRCSHDHLLVELGRPPDELVARLLASQRHSAWAMAPLSLSQPALVTFTPEQGLAGVMSGSCPPAVADTTRGVHMSERTDDNNDLAEIEQWLANQDGLNAPYGLEETSRVLRNLLDALGVLDGVDVGTLYAAAENVQLGQAWGTLQVLAGLAGRLSQGV